MQREVKQFDDISKEYASFVDEDTVRNFLHYPSVIKLLGKVRGKKILDVGCGNGLFDRILARESGALITGYDKAAELIALAKDEEDKNPLGNKYCVDDPLTFQADELYDDSLSVMVLPYAPDADYLEGFFGSTYQALKSGGRFISVIFNPAFRAFDTVVANRIFKQKDGKVEVNFLKPKPANSEVKFTALLNQFSAAEYTEAGRKAGFQKLEWEKLYPTQEGIKLLGEEFWQVCEQTQPYAIFIAQK